MCLMLGVRYAIKPNLVYLILSQVTASREPYREMHIKVHIRRPGRDSWSYIGRGTATQEILGHSSRVGKHRLECYLEGLLHKTLLLVIRQTGTGKVLVVFSEVTTFRFTSSFSLQTLMAHC
jgi:hypothetical protein